jgi:outer membrane murein-binding lipoprotein Lpp
VRWAVVLFLVLSACASSAERSAIRADKLEARADELEAEADAISEAAQSCSVPSDMEPVKEPT